jgi:HlyD family secretion protein
VQAGDVVKKDQPTATLESPELRNELEREQASLAGLEVAVQRQGIDTRKQLAANQQASDLANVAIQAAERELRRAEDSWKQKVISERDFEKARDDAASARVNHKHALETAGLQKESLEFELRARRLERDRQRLVVEELQRRVGDLNVKSPVNGIVGTLAVAERASVAQNAPLITVVDLTAFEIEIQVPESYADDLGLGMEAEVTSGNRKYPAKVSAVSPEVRSGQVTGRLRFSGETPQGLRQNQRLSTRIVLESREDVLKVQRGAFLDSGGGRVAYVVQDDLTERRTIRTGAASVSEVEILEGPSELHRPRRLALAAHPAHHRLRHRLELARQLGLAVRRERQPAAHDLAHLAQLPGGGVAGGAQRQVVLDPHLIVHGQLAVVQRLQQVDHRRAHHRVPHGRPPSRRAARAFTSARAVSSADSLTSCCLTSVSLRSSVRRASASRTSISARLRREA